MEWHYKNGYRSEDSEDEMTIYGRSERQYYRQLRQMYGEDTILLKKRAIMPFERLFIDQLGGRSLFSDLCGKQIEADIDQIYDYQLPGEKIDAARPHFLQVENRAEFNHRYS